jgi:hypothetical protein
LSWREGKKENKKGLGSPLTTFTKVYKEGETIMPSSTHEIIASSFRTTIEIKRLKLRRYIKIPPTWEPTIPIDTNIYNVHIDSNDVFLFFMKRGEGNV